jgi:hypothetical protein
MLTSPLSSGDAPAGEKVAGPAPGAGVDVLAQPAGAGQQTARVLRSRLVLRFARQRLAVAAGQAAWPAAVYSGSRLLLAAVAGVAALAGGRPLATGFFLFDGQWYLRLAEHGYPHQALHTKSTLGFLPLYPLLIRAVTAVSWLSIPRAALIASVAGGLAAAVLAHRLATAWWGEQAGRWATVAFCFFPGSIVFSMAYSECLTIPLALGCLLALRSHRWQLAGLLAGLATAVEPVAVVLVAACLAAAAQQIRSRTWRDPAARRSLAAPLLAPLGLGIFAVFLWAWTGTPLATYIAQHYGWHQQSQPLALLALPVAKHLLGHPASLLAHVFTWNIWNGVLGGVFLAFSIAALARVRDELSPGALVLAAGIGLVTLWSVMTPPNARMDLLAFPAVLVWGRRLAGRRLAVFLAVEAVVLVAASLLTYSGRMLP